MYTRWTYIIQQRAHALCIATSLRAHAHMYTYANACIRIRTYIVQQRKHALWIITYFEHLCLDCSEPKLPAPARALMCVFICMYTSSQTLNIFALIVRNLNCRHLHEYWCVCLCVCVRRLKLWTYLPWLFGSWTAGTCLSIHAYIFWYLCMHTSSNHKRAHTQTHLLNKTRNVHNQHDKQKKNAHTLTHIKNTFM